MALASQLRDFLGGPAAGDWLRRWPGWTAAAALLLIPCWAKKHLSAPAGGTKRPDEKMARSIGKGNCP